MIKLSTIKEVRDLIGDEWREAVICMDAQENDFELVEYRFIHKDSIDSIMQDELSADEYMLGCFNACFLADVLDIDQDAIESMQRSGAYEAIGKLVLRLNKLEELQKEYIRHDGYGNHFAHYDGSEEMIDDYYVFKIA